MASKTKKPNTPNTPKAKKPVARVAAPKPRPAPKPPVVKAPTPAPAPAPVAEEAPVVEMEDFNFGGYVVQAPKGSTPLYSESHPILGLTKAVFQVENAPGDGRVGGAGKQYVWRK